MEPDPTPDGVIENTPMLDLTGMSSPDELHGISQLKNVAVVLVPEALSGALASIPMENVASVVPIPGGARPSVHTGSIVMGGEGLADPAASDKVLVVTGTLALTTPVEHVSYREIIVTGLVLAPHGSESALAAGLSRVTGAIRYYRYAEGQQIRTYAGQVTLGPETLANEGGSNDDVLVVSGQVVVTGPIHAVGYQLIVGAGQLLLPRASQELLAPVLSSEGQLVWYAGDRVRVFTGHESFSQAFFELIDEPLALMLMGSIVIEDDVSASLLRDKVSEITLVGKIVAPREVVPVLQLLTTEKQGKIVTAQDDDGAG